MCRAPGSGVLAAALVAAGALLPAWAAALPADTPAMVEHRLTGRMLPDIRVTLDDGRQLRLSELWRDQPLLLTFYYRRCPGICTPFLEGIRDAIGAVGGLERDYRVLALTLDDTETVTDLRAQARAFNVLDAPGWSFAVTTAEQVERITDALGFRFQPDPDTRLYDHEALLVGVDRGRVLRALSGAVGERPRLRELLWDLRGRFVAMYSIPGRTVLRCLRFDPVTGRLQFDWGLLILLLPGSAAVMIALGLFTGTGHAAAPPRVRGSGQSRSRVRMRLRGGSSMSR